MSIENLEHLFKKLESLDGNIIKSGEIHMRKAIKRVTSNAKQRAAVGVTGQLRESYTDEVEAEENEVIGVSGTNLEYAVYAELGAGPKGQEGSSILPEEIRSKITYKTDGWWIHESQIDERTAEKYHFFKMETKDGIFYHCMGQAPNPSLYPAFEEEKEKVINDIAKGIREDIKKLGG